MAFKIPFDKKNLISETDFTTEDNQIENKNFFLNNTEDIKSINGKFFEIFKDYSYLDLELL